MSELNNNCQFICEEEDPDLHYYIIPIYENEIFYLEFAWSEDAHNWILWLVHIETGDKCDLASEDSTTFVDAHGGAA
jgi:hypothetical protein